MTKSDPKAVVKALEAIVAWDEGGEGSWDLAGPHTRPFAKAKAAIPIARSIAEQWDELVEAKAALEWLISALRKDIKESSISLQLNDCPTILKQMIEQKEKS